MALELRIWAHSETGLIRKDNQDSGFASPTMVMVADGMGGAAAGDLASRIAIDEFHRVDGQGRGEDMLDVLDAACRRANTRLAALVDQDPDLDGMGTTVSGGLFDGQDLGIVHLGDSRGYLLRGDRLLRLTHDHSWVQSLIDEGRLGERAALTHPHRSLLLRVLNGQPYSRPDLLLVRLRDGDRLLFCTDGLCGLVDDPAIAGGLSLPDPTAALDDLVQAAHQAGGSDNITIILADVVDPNPAAATSNDTVPLTLPEPTPAPTTPPVAPITLPGAQPALVPLVAASAGSGQAPTAAAQSSQEADPTTAPPEAAPSAPGQAPTTPGANTLGLNTASPSSQEAAPTSPTTPDEAVTTPDDRTVPVDTPAAFSPSSAASPWATRRAEIIAAPPVQGEGRPAGAGRLIGAAASTAPLSLDGEAAAESGGGQDGPRRPGRHRLLGRVALVLAVIVVALAGLTIYTSQQYFVGEGDGRVAVFRGFPGSIAGWATSWEQSRSDIALADLPYSQRDRLRRGVEVDDRAAADALVDQLALESLACLERRAARQAGQADPTPTVPGASAATSGSSTAATSQRSSAASPASASPSPTPRPTATTVASPTANATTVTTAAAPASPARATPSPTTSITLYPDDGC
ncbi:MAG: protein phosphatase 2C domain-containing protein [Propionibacteriaceae bacterium]|jgi:serine/threonine protein phosphatase PrpC|nr:protein phosphatase 2C domain-containing protein [Propionibacteriaceae bacterium]